MIHDSGSYHSLPPLKRFTLLHHRRPLPSLDDDKENLDPSLPLPAKKRKESRPPFVERPLTHPLPTKKRIWAPPPDPTDFLPLFDLNSDYKPLSDEGDGIASFPVREAAIEQPSVLYRNGEEEKAVEGWEKDQHPISEEDISPSEAAESEVPDESERNPEEEEEEDDGILCAICQSTDGDPEDPIVFCDGCDLMTHATCYGNPLIRGIPDGEWYCHRCQASSEDGSSIACCLCPNMGGAMKPTVDGRWAHVVCAVFVPEVFFEDAEGRERVNCSAIDGRKTCAKRCYVCGGQNGCLVECSESRCKRGFHVTCGLEEDLWLDYKEGRGKAIVAGFCREHTELWKKQQLTGKFKIVSRVEKL